jgi:hypothetical protein
VSKTSVPWPGNAGGVIAKASGNNNSKGSIALSFISTVKFSPLLNIRVSYLSVDEKVG